MNGTTGTNEVDPFNFERFTQAQDPVYDTVLAELKAGRKRTHWMWFIFPQIAGLGSSPTSRFYAIGGLDEAAAYLAHPVLGARLKECAQAVLDAEARSASEIFGSPDDLKLRSSMTLFSLAAGADPMFARVLEKYFGGEQDGETRRLLKTL